MTPRHPLLANGVRDPVEHVASGHFGRQWRVRDFKNLDDRACHPAALLSDGENAVFAKLSAAPEGQDQFEVELAGLRLLAVLPDVLTPPVVGTVSVEGGVVLVQEAVRTAPAPPADGAVGRLPPAYSAQSQQ